MKKDKFKTKVIFYYDPFNRSEIFAYFPENIFDIHGNMASYAHVGQHPACGPEYVEGLGKATPEQYYDLKTELEGLGYNLTVLNKTEV